MELLHSTTTKVNLLNLFLRSPLLPQDDHAEVFFLLLHETVVGRAELRWLDAVRD